MESSDKNIVLIGDGYVGKSSIVKVLRQENISDQSNPNLLDQVYYEATVEDTSVNFNIIDTAGQEEYDFIRKEAYKKATIFLLCFSLADKSSFENITSKWIKDIQNYKDVPIILVGTKSDIEMQIRKDNCLKLQRKIKAIEYIQCSSKTKEGIDEIINCAAKCLQNNSQKKNCCIQ